MLSPDPRPIASAVICGSLVDKEFEKSYEQLKQCLDYHSNKKRTWHCEDDHERRNQVGNDNVDLHDHEVKLDAQPLAHEVIRESKKRKREGNLVTWKWNDVIEIESSDNENMFDDVLSMSNIKRKKRNQVSVFIRNKIYRLIDEDDEEEDDIFG
ncbi:hypothetical protein Tco_1317087 [Tanacetum coccineum]